MPPSRLALAAAGARLVAAAARWSAAFWGAGVIAALLLPNPDLAALPVVAAVWAATTALALRSGSLESSGGETHRRPWFSALSSRRSRRSFEGVFGRAFRTHVQPVELARKLAKEMDDHRHVSVSRVYVPNEYTVFLSPADREQFAGYEDSLVDELQEYLAEHSRREVYALLSRPNVLIETDDDLEVGEFGIATRMVQPERGRAEEEPEAPVADVEAGATMIYKPAAPARDAGGLAGRARARAGDRRAQPGRRTPRDPTSAGR